MAFIEGFDWQMVRQWLFDVPADVHEDVGRFVGEDAQVSVFVELLQHRVRCC